jgi:Protein of unknown function DUF104
MTITVEAIFENGVLKPTQPLALQEHERVRLTVQRASGGLRPNVVPCQDAALIEWAASDAELDFSPPHEEP